MTTLEPIRAGTLKRLVGSQPYWDRAGLVDLVQVAHLHALVRHGDLARLPRIDEMPAFRKLALGNLSPQLSLRVLDESGVQVQELRSLLA